MTRAGAVRFVLVVLGALLLALPARAEGAISSVEDAGACGSARAACAVDEPDAAGAPAPPPPRADAAGTVTLLFFWGVGCPHCEEAKPFVDALEKEEPRVRIERVEVRRDADGRRRFVDEMGRLGVGGAGVPAFVAGDRYVVGFAKGETEAEIRALVRRALEGGAAAEGPAPVHVPLLGTIDPRSVSLPWLTLAMGLVDGVNPCAMWVLVVLMGILLHVRERHRMLLYALVFILTSGIVYFLFMAAWAALFRLVGLSRVATMLLGGVLLLMGLLNLKELVWFKRGVSLMIPDKAKPGLFRRMRGIAGAASLPAALGGVVALAFVVNLIELGCTIGLPAIYTRILAVRGLSTGARMGYLALYNVVYVVPLLAIALAFVALRRRLTMTERLAKVLKGVSGALLVAFGAIFLVAPELLSAGR